MTDAAKRGIDLLNALEVALQEAGLWANAVPSDEALASQQPFARDTLRLEQWLQFVLLPRMRTLLLQPDTAIPPMAIKPMAEISWAQRHAKVQRVLSQLDAWSES